MVLRRRAGGPGGGRPSGPRAGRVWGTLDPDALAVLADAPEEAGGGGMVVHLRGPGPHVAGCWTVDALTGRE
jgi:hypothetical protein